jgi:hypothetical protein
MQRLAIAIGAQFLMGATAIDWKLYGASNLGWEELRSFYGEIEVMPGGHLQVSTEDLTLDGLVVAEQNDRTPGRATSKLSCCRF